MNDMSEVSAMSEMSEVSELREVREVRVYKHRSGLLITLVPYSCSELATFSNGYTMIRA